MSDTEDSGVCDRCHLELDYAPYVSLDGLEWLCEDCYHDEIIGAENE